MRRRKVPRIERLRMATDGRCWYCARPLTRDETTVDHVIPKSKGGKTQDGNLVCCCYACNQRKASLTLEEFRAQWFGGLPFWGECVA